jgi:hypothetical protein
LLPTKYLMRSTKCTILDPLLLLLIFLSLVVGEREDVFTPKRLKVIDSVQYGAQPDRFNILFRSNRPTNGVPNVFYYDDLFNAMTEAAKTRELRITNSHKTYMIIFSLLQTDDMTNYLENSYFEKHPDKGEMRNYPILGTTLSPETFSEQEIQTKTASLNSWLPDPLDFLVQEIHSTLNNFTNPDINLLVLFHCTHGYVLYSYSIIHPNSFYFP